MAGPFYRCDRCGMQRLGPCGEGFPTHWQTILNKLLCDTCFRDLCEFMKPLPLYKAVPQVKE